MTKVFCDATNKKYKVPYLMLDTRLQEWVKATFYNLDKMRKVTIYNYDANGVFRAIGIGLY
jgi:hypothetical protein